MDGGKKKEQAALSSSFCDFMTSRKPLLAEWLAGFALLCIAWLVSSSFLARNVCLCALKASTTTTPVYVIPILTPAAGKVVP